MSGSWEAMLDDEQRRSNLARRRELSNKRKADLIDLVLLHERVNDEHEASCVCVTCGLLHTAPTEHEDWCHTVTGCTEPGHCTCDHEIRRQP